MSEHTDIANDYALAKHLNEHAIAIFTLVNDHRNTPDITAVNRSYVLLVNELKQIYTRQPELHEIRESICWRHFDNLGYIHEEAGGYLEYVDDYGQSHNTKVHNLCIITGKENPDITSQLKKILDEADKNVADFRAELDKMNATLAFESMVVPVVTIGNKSHRLSSMREGLAYNVISYCLAKHPNQTVELDALRAELKVADIKAYGLNNLKDNIRKSHFGENNPLSPFVEASPKKILVWKSAALTNYQIETIKAACK